MLRFSDRILTVQKNRRYIQVAGNTNSGVEGRLSTTRKLKDNALSSATLVAYLSSPGFDGNIRYDADDDGSVIPGSGVEIFAYGFRNPYDIGTSLLVVCVSHLQ